MELFPYEKKHLEMLRPYLGECTVLLKQGPDFRVSKPCSVALFGNGVRHTQKGGTGSGDVNSRYFHTVEEAFEKKGFLVTTKKWLDQYDDTIPLRRKAFGKQIRQEARKAGQFYLVYGMGMVMEEQDFSSPPDGEGELCIYVLSRTSGEGNDRKVVPGDYLLTKTEEETILALNGKFEKFVLVLNVGGPVDLSPVLGVKNILLLSQLGTETSEALVDIVMGCVNPSGKLTTSWVQAKDDPTKGNFGSWSDTVYQEGVYVGYRYYDTKGIEPLFPFGYGLTFTTFGLSPGKCTLEGTKVTVSITIRNTGKENGKETVQLYVSSPQGKGETPYQSLMAYGKTTSLQPGEEENLSLTFDMKDAVTFSEKDSAYILESGDYVIRVGDSSRNTTVVAVLTLQEKVVIRKVKALFPEVEVEEIKLPYRRETIGADVPRFPLDPSSFRTETVSYLDSMEQDPLLSTFSDEDLVNLSVGGYKVTFGVDSIVGESSTKLSGAAGETTTKLESKGIPTLVMTDGPAGIRISRDYWKDKKGFHTIGGSLFPDQRDLMDPFIRFALKILDGKPRRKDEVKHQYCTAIPIGTALAQSFNTDLAYLCGKIIREEMEYFKIDLWLAPALNIHRSVLCGRNFEYYSEDPLLSGRTAAAITNGVQSVVGKGVAIKHFAANNQETNRYHSNSIVSERAFRDIYLKAFEICLKESEPLSVMTSYNLLNGLHTSENKALIEDVLRGELGFDGLVMTDWIVASIGGKKNEKYPDPKATMVAKAGNDLFMPGSEVEIKDLQESLSKGLLERKELERNVGRILGVMKKLGRLE